MRPPLRGRPVTPAFQANVPYNPITGEYAPLAKPDKPLKIRLFEATGDLTYNDPLDAVAPTVTAKKLIINRATGERETVGDDITIHMTTADWDDTASEYLGTVHVFTGDRFWAMWDQQARRWEVLMPVENGYNRCTATLKGALAGGASCTVDNVLVIRGASPLDDPEDDTEELIVYNPHAYDGDDNALVRIEWNVTSEQWEIYQITCPSS